MLQFAIWSIKQKKKLKHKNIENKTSCYKNINSLSKIIKIIIKI